MFFGQTSPTDSEVSKRLFSGDYTVIDDLAEIGTPEAIGKLHAMVFQFKRSTAASEHPEIRPRAIEALRSIEGAADELAGRVAEMSRRGEPSSSKSTICYTLRAMRNEEAVRAMGELLFDNFQLNDLAPGEAYAKDMKRPAPNRSLAARSFASWLEGDPKAPFDIIETQTSREAQYDWADWWRERKNDPAIIKAIVEGTPLPPLKPKVSRSVPSEPKVVPSEPPATAPEPPVSKAVANTETEAKNHSNRWTMVAIGGFVALLFAIALIFVAKRAR